MGTRVIDIAFNRYLVTGTGTININVGFEPKMIDFLSLFHLGDTNTRAISPGNDFESPNGLHSVPISKGAATSTSQIVQSTNVDSDSMNSHVTFMGDGYVVYQVFVNTSGENIIGRNRISLTSFTSVGFTLEVHELFNTNTIIYRAFR